MTDREFPTAAPSALGQPAPGPRGGDVPHAALTDLVPCVVWTSRPDGWVDYANPFWLRYTGLTLEETYGWGWTAGLHSEDRARVTDVWPRALRTGEQVDLEYCL